MGTPGVENTPTFVQEYSMKLVGSADLDKFWPSITNILKREPQVLEYYDIPDIYILAKRGAIQLFVFSDQFELCACIVTEIRSYPRISVMNIITGAALPGHNALELTTFYELLENWGYNTGARLGQVPCARKGWVRILEPLGYEFAGVVLKKKLEPIKEQ